MTTFRSDVRVELVDYFGSDASVASAARVSTGTAVRENESGLINYLMRDRHGSPFEHNAFTFYVEAPIFVFREFMRHRIASYNEESGRYRELLPEFYIPSEDRDLVQVGKPGAYVFEKGTGEQHKLVTDSLTAVSEHAYFTYQEMLSQGVAREVARMVLPLNIYSRMFVTLNARSLMNFLSLRVKSDDSKYQSFPQREIEMAAEQMETLWSQKMPQTHASFVANGRVAP